MTLEKPALQMGSVADKGIKGTKEYSAAAATYSYATKEYSRLPLPIHAQQKEFSTVFSWGRELFENRPIREGQFVPLSK